MTVTLDGFPCSSNSTEALAFPVPSEEVPSPLIGTFVKVPKYGYVTLLYSTNTV